MRRALAPVLILLLVLTGATLGAARGQIRQGGAVVLCAGAGVTVVTLDAQGRPARHLHVCPDMALSVLAGSEGGAIALPPRAVTAPRVVRPAPKQPAVLADAVAAQARGPPAGAFA